MSNHYRLIGNIGSPYSMKMRAIMRYRRIPFLWVNRNQKVSQEIAHVKPPVIPVLQYPEDGSYHVDSTPMAYELERRHPSQRSIIPEDPGLAFLSHVIEDLADEWVTKMMFTYRWWRRPDQEYCSYWLTHMMAVPAKQEDVKQMAEWFTERQVGRMPLVGCTEITRPIIERTFLEVLDILEQNLETSVYLFGSRPALADFGLFGQLYQLCYDPTSQTIMREKAPGVCSWISRLDDASGEDGGVWIDADGPLPTAVMEFLRMTGDVYFPFLLANARAFEQGEETFSLTLRGEYYEQGTFKYQVKCLKWLREEYAGLEGNAKERVDAALKETGCWEPLQG
jgi:glutathione S-transferase